jgi:hypothetical protein
VSRSRRCRERSTTNAASGDQQHLAELGGLEGEERKADRALGPVGTVPKTQHRQDAEQQRCVDRRLVPSQQRVVDPCEHHHRDGADDQVDRLAVDVVARAPRHQPGGGRPQGRHRAEPQPDHRRRQQRVQRKARSRTPSILTSARP